MKFNTYFRIVLPLSTAALVAMTMNAYATETPSVVDPTTGQTVSVSEIDMSSLTDDQRQDVRDQMTEMGMDQEARDAHGMPDGKSGMDGMDGMDSSADSDGGNAGGGNGGGNGGGGNGGGGNGGSGMN